MSSVAARRYAKALFLLAEESGNLDAVREDLQSISSLLTASVDLKAFCAARQGTANQRTAALQEIFKGKVHDVTLRFLLFIDSKGRLNILNDIQGAFETLYSTSKGILSAAIVSAMPLTGEQKESIEQRLAKRFQKIIHSSTSVDPALIGGFTVQIGDHVYDYSIESQLRSIQRELISA